MASSINDQVRLFILLPYSGHIFSRIKKYHPIVLSTLNFWSFRRPVFKKPELYLNHYLRNLISDLDSDRMFLSTVQNLNKHGFRTISWEANSCYQNAFTKRGSLFLSAEIVWVKIPNAFNVSAACGF